VTINGGLERRRNWVAWETHVAGRMAKRKSVMADKNIRRLGAALLASIALALALVAFKTLQTMA
jgi:hypothetical protein